MTQDHVGGGKSMRIAVRSPGVQTSSHPPQQGTLCWPLFPWASLSQPVNQYKDDPAPPQLICRVYMRNQEQSPGKHSLSCPALPLSCELHQKGPRCSWDTAGECRRWGGSLRNSWKKSCGVKRHEPIHRQISDSEKCRLDSKPQSLSNYVTLTW